MAKQRHLPRAPIREALIDVRFASSATYDDVKVAAAQLRWAGGDVGDLWEATIEVRPPQEGTGPKHVASMVGTRLSNPGNTQVLQLRTGGFTFSQLAPYTTWESMFDLAYGAWERYSAALKASVIQRVAVRYINALQFPEDSVDLEKYFVSAPRIPPMLPQTLVGYLQKVQFPIGGDLATVAQTIENPGGNFLLDIEVATSGHAVEASDVSSVLTRLRDHKNAIFFEYITESTAEQYE